MYCLLIVVVSLSLAQAECNASQWFNEHHPWEAHLQGNDVERFSIIQAKYPDKFVGYQWTGEFEVRRASEQGTNNTSILNDKHALIKDGVVCHSVNGIRCYDYEIRFCLEHKSCGLSSYPPSEIRIVGGTEALPHSLPWHVSIQFDGNHICGGTLLDDRHILTTAHCFRLSLFPIQYTVLLGAHNLTSSGHRFSVQRIMSHPDYNDVTFENDISLIRLNESIQPFSDIISPACLPLSIREPYVSRPLIVAGWGTTSTDQSAFSITEELRQTILTVMGECSRIYYYFALEKQVCAGVEDYASDSCQGDSGGGLFQKQQNGEDRWAVTGIVSYGKGCAEVGWPGVYVRVSAYLGWIQNSIARMNKEGTNQ